MSDATTTVVDAIAEPVTQTRFAAMLLASAPWTATPEQAAALYAAYTALPEPLPVEEYLSCAEDYTDAATMLADVAPDATTDATTQKPVGLSVPDATTTPDMAAEVAQDQAAAQQASLETLQECVKVYRATERSQTAGLLETGRLAEQYVVQRLALSPPETRKSAIAAVERMLDPHASDKVDANRLIGCYHAYRLLVGADVVDAASNAPKGKPGKEARDAVSRFLDVPYGHYREWKQCIERQCPDTKAEHWIITPSIATKATEAFHAAVKSGLSRAAVVECVKALLGKPATTPKTPEPATTTTPTTDAPEQPVDATEPATTPEQPAPKPDSPVDASNGPRNLQQPGAPGTAKDMAEYAAEYVLQHDDPDGVLEALVTLLARHKDMHHTTQAACGAFLVAVAKERTARKAG